MFSSPLLRNIPRAHLDPIRTPFDALQLIMMMTSANSAHETLVVALDDRSCGVGIGRVLDTEDPDSLPVIVDRLVEAASASDDVTGLILATVRPHGLVALDDLERWHEVDDACGDADIDLVEWFVIGTTISCPRELCGVPARWDR